MMSVDFLKLAYSNKWLTQEQIKSAVTKGYITQDDYNEIVTPTSQAQS